MPESVRMTISHHNAVSHASVAAIPLPARQSLPPLLDISPTSWYFSSIIARPPSRASTLTTAYAPNPRPSRSYATARVAAWTPPHPHQIVPFLPPTVPFLAAIVPDRCRFCRPERETSRCREPQTGLNPAFERRSPPIQNEKAAKTAMVTIPVNFAHPVRRGSPSPRGARGPGVRTPVLDFTI
jgi:hypothetical protein